MPKRGERKPFTIRYVWGTGRKGTMVYGSVAEASRAVLEFKARAVVSRSTLTLTVTNRDTGERVGGSFDFTDRLPLRDEPGGDQDW